MARIRERVVVISKIVNSRFIIFPWNLTKTE